MIYPLSLVESVLVLAVFCAFLAFLLFKRKAASTIIKVGFATLLVITYLYIASRIFGSSQSLPHIFSGAAMLAAQFMFAVLAMIASAFVVLAASLLLIIPTVLLISNQFFLDLFIPALAIIVAIGFLAVWIGYFGINAVQGTIEITGTPTLIATILVIIPSTICATSISTHLFR